MMRWYVVFTKARQERVALENLRRQGFETFLPMAHNPYQRHRSARLAEPLFPRYLFIAADARRQALATVRSTRGAVGLVRAGTEPLAAPPDVMEALFQRTDPDTGLVGLEPVVLGPGDRVRVFDGPMAGIEGIFRARSGERRALLLLSLLGRETEIEVDPLHLRRAG